MHIKTGRRRTKHNRQKKAAQKAEAEERRDGNGEPEATRAVRAGKRPGVLRAGGGQEKHTRKSGRRGRGKGESKPRRQGMGNDGQGRGQKARAVAPAYAARPSGGERDRPQRVTQPAWRSTKDELSQADRGGGSPQTAPKQPHHQQRGRGGRRQHRQGAAAYRVWQDPGSTQGAGSGPTGLGGSRKAAVTA